VATKVAVQAATGESRAQRGLQQQGVPEGDLRLCDGEETLRIASRFQQERSILAKAIKEIVVDHRAEKRWLAVLVARGEEEIGHGRYPRRWQRRQGQRRTGTAGPGAGRWS
jgi:hypothetical protein